MRMATNEELRNLERESIKEGKRAYLLTSGRITFDVSSMNIYERAIKILAIADGHRLEVN